MDNILENIIAQLVRIAHPDKIILFGSHATGKANKDSDYDILVLKKNMKCKQMTSKIYMNLQANVPVDILATTPNRFDTLKNKWYYIHSDIAKEGKVIYEK